MRVLALETSAEMGSVALLDGESVSERIIPSPRQQTETVLPHIDTLLAEAGIGLAALDAIAFGRGPGSFTGLRVATAVAQGIGVALGIPLLPVSSLAAIAQGLWRRHEVAQSLICVDARMGELFWGRFGVHNGLVQLIGAEQLSVPADVGSGFDGSWVAAGSGLKAQQELPRALLAGAQAVFPDAGPLARDLIPLALDDLAHGRIATVEEALPVYLRREDAWRR